MRTLNPVMEFADAWETPKTRHKHNDHEVTVLRHEHGLSQEALAEVWGITRDLLAGVEAGRRSLPFTLEEGRQMLEAIAEERSHLQAAVGAILRGLP